MHEETGLSKDLPDSSGRPRRLRAAGASLAAFLALGLPIDGADRLGSVETASRAIPDFPPGLAPSDRYTIFPAGLAGVSSELSGDFDAAVWDLVLKSCDRFGIAEKAVAMYGVLWEESRLDPEASSSCGRYHGIGQFTAGTFRWAVGEMRARGLLPPGVKYSPYDPTSAIDVMAFMWAEEMEPQWGPYKRVIRRLQRQEKVASKAALVSKPN